MEQRLSLITLGVEDLARSQAFYEAAFGWRAHPGPEGVAFYQMNGFILALFPRMELAKDARVDLPPAPGPMSLAWNGRSEAEVDAAYAAAVKAGAKPIKTPEKAFWGGYSGYVADPDGHLIELAHNPFWTIAADGAVSLG